MRIATSLAAAALAGVVSGCGTATLDATSAPPALRLLDNTAVALGAPAVAGGGAAGFVLRTTLPAAPPSPASVYRLPRATADDADAVAHALGIVARPAPIRGGWVARNGARLLAVSADGSWTYGLDCTPSDPIERESLQVMCGTATAGTAVAVRPGGPMPVPTPPPPGPSAARARALAAPILTRLGLAQASAVVADGWGETSVIATGPVDGLTVADRQTSLAFDRSGALVSGGGSVGTPARGRAYPLIDAARAYAMLRDQPRPMPLLCRPSPGGRGCLPVHPEAVVGATLGLALRHDATGPLLVPAWLFRLQGRQWPLAVIAVDPHFLLPPASTVPPPGKPGVVQPAAPSPAGTGSSTWGSSTRG